MRSSFLIVGCFTAIIGFLWFCDLASCQTVRDSSDGLAQRTPFDPWNSGELEPIGSGSLFVSSPSSFVDVQGNELAVVSGPVSDSHKRLRIPLMPYWENGLRFISQDEQFNLHVGGNFQWDSVWLGDSNGNLAEPSSNATSTTDGAASLLRRGRFKFDGNIYESFDYSLEFDLAIWCVSTAQQFRRHRDR